MHRESEYFGPATDRLLLAQRLAGDFMYEMQPCAGRTSHGLVCIGFVVRGAIGHPNLNV